MFPQDDTTTMRFGNYEVLNRPDGRPHELGRGGFGRTYRARHTFLGTEVALKVILDRLAFDAAAKRRFLNEAQEHARLNHPGIARITDFGEMEGTFFYAMELCPDGDLKEYVKKQGPVPSSEALHLIRQTAEALQFAHSCGILHRDVKPSNLLLVFSEQRVPYVKLIDFGLVKRIMKSADEMSDPDAGAQWSPAFASPEQIREHALDERTDIFSLGMTAWFLIAGGGPVEGSTAEIVQERLSDASYESQLPATLTGKLRSVVAKMVEKSSARRFRNCSELLEELSEALRGVTAPQSKGRTTTQSVPLTERFILEPAGRSYLGEVFKGLDRDTRMRVRLTVLNKEHDATLVSDTKERALKLSAAQPPGLVPFLEFSEFAEGSAVVEEECSGPVVAEVLRREGTVPLVKMAGFLWDAATGIDAAVECGAAPARLEEAIIEGAGSELFDWQTAQLRIPLHLAAPQEKWIAVSDVTNDPQQASPLKAFASLVYLAVGGRRVPSQAFYSSAACIAIPGLSSNGNRTLAACLADESKPDSCRDLLQSLFIDEGLSPDSVARRAQERRLKSLDVALSRETFRIDRAAATVEAVKGNFTADPADLSLTLVDGAAARATELTEALKAPGSHTEAACREALRELRSLAGKAEIAAATFAERFQKAAGSQTLQAKLPTRGPQVSNDRQAELLLAIDVCAREAKNLSEQASRIKLPPGADDAALCQLQREALRSAKEAAITCQQAHDREAAGKLDLATATQLAESAHLATVAASHALDAALRLVANLEAESKTVRTQAIGVGELRFTPHGSDATSDSSSKQRLAFRLAPFRPTSNA